MSKRILLADDSVTIRKVVELTFMEEDYELETTTNGREALTKLEESKPDLVVADVHMPEVDGFEVARESKQRYPEVPVLLLVGTFEPFDPAEVKACGADEFLKKPFDSQDLLRQVSRLLDRMPAEADEAAPAEEPAGEVAEAAAGGLVAAAGQDGGAEEAPEAEADSSAAGLSDADVDRIARRVAELLSDNAVREVAWEVIPDMAEVVIKDRLEELEGQVD